MTVLSNLLTMPRTFSDLPCGAFLPYGGSSAPTGFLLCQGQAISRVTYADLFAVLGTTFGAGDASTTFNLPDLRGRGVIGAGTGTGGGASGTGAPTGGSALTARTLGAWLGAETHALSIAELAAHTHSVEVNATFAVGSGAAATVRQAGTTTSGSTGSGTAHNNIQPVVVSNWIVKYVTSFNGSQAMTDLPRGYIDGLTLSNGTDADHDINIAVGKCRDSADSVNFSNTSTLVKQLDAAWAAGSAAGGLFSGSIANSTWYHVFLIRKDSDGTIDAGYDTSVTAANKPAGYSTYRRIGSVLTNGSANILGFTQSGDNFYWNLRTTDFSGTAPTVLTNLTVSVPLGVVCKAFVRVAAYSGGAETYYSAAHANSDGTTVTRTSMVGFNTSATAFYGSESQTLTNTSSQIKHQCGHATNTASLYTTGWSDSRGRDA